MFEDNTYLHNKDILYTQERQQEMEAQMDVYFHCVSRGYNPETGETRWGSSRAMTRKQIGNYLGEHVIIDVRSAYPIGFNYDVHGRKMNLP